MSSLKKWFIFTFIILSQLNVWGGNNNYLSLSDKSIFPDFFKYMMEITSEDMGKINYQLFVGYLNSGDKNLLVVKEPKAYQGIVHLRNDENMWTYYPTAKRSFYQAFQSIILGDIISYGDVLSLSLSYDYDVIDVKEQENNYLLVLVTNGKSKSYAKILLWIDKENYQPIKREYYSKSNELIKICIFKEIKRYSMDSLPYEIIMEFKEPFRNRSAVVRLFNIEVGEKIPLNYYTPDALRHISGE